MPHLHFPAYLPELKAGSCESSNRAPWNGEGGKHNFIFWPESGLVFGEFLGTELVCPGASKGLQSSQSRFGATKRWPPGLGTSLDAAPTCMVCAGVGGWGGMIKIGGPAKSDCWHCH